MARERHEIVWLVDSEDYLARLLRLKLAAIDLELQRLTPADLESMEPMPEASGTAVIVSLPQPGVSSRELLNLVRKRFPFVPVLELTTNEDRFSRTSQRGVLGGQHRFYKPLVEMEPFIQAIQKAVSHLPESCPIGG